MVVTTLAATMNMIALKYVAEIGKLLDMTSSNEFLSLATLDCK